MTDVTNQLRKECHCYIDKMAFTHKEREQIYKWLAKALKIPLYRCHISLFGYKLLVRAKHKLHKEYIRRNKQNGKHK